MRTNTPRRAAAWLAGGLVCAVVACGGGAGGAAAPSPSSTPAARQSSASPPAEPAPAGGAGAGQACHLTTDDARTLLGRPVFQPSGLVLDGASAYPGYRVARVDRCAYPLV